MVSGLQGNMPAHHMTAVVWREEERTEGRGEGGEGGREEGREGKSLRYIVERVLTITHTHTVTHVHTHTHSHTHTHLHVIMMVFSPSQEGLSAMTLAWVVTSWGES